jgi:hypothetical protein
VGRDKSAPVALEVKTVSALKVIRRKDRSKNLYTLTAYAQVNVPNVNGAGHKVGQV